MWLKHHGILGQKWGVRRFQYSDGSLTEEGRQRYRSMSRVKRHSKTKKDVDDIVNSLSPEDRRKLGLRPDEKEYLSLEGGEWVAKRILLKHGDKPVAFFDVFADDKTANISLAVRTDEQGKGYGKIVTEKGMQYVNKNLNKWQHVEWNAIYDNYASRHLAEKYGFVHEPEMDYTHNGDRYASYIKRPSKG